MAVERGRLGVVLEDAAGMAGMTLMGRMGLLDLRARVSESDVSIHSGRASKEKFGKSDFRLGDQKLIPKYVRFVVNAMTALIAAMRASLSSVLLKRSSWCFAELAWIL